MDYKISLFKLNFDEREEKAVVNTLQSKWISIGPKCKEFENYFSELLQVKNSVSLSNCTDALHLALKALGVGEGDEVLCPSLSFAATANCIKYVGAVPVFCDVKSVDNLTIDINEIKLKFTQKTKAIIVMHYAGFACDMDSIMSFARKHNIKVIEDACHGPLSEYKGKKLGVIGDIGCFSFFSNKNISTGEGGMLVTNNDVLAEKVKLLRSHGMTTMSYERSKGHATSYNIEELGFNCRMDDIRASIGIVQLQKLKIDLDKRSEVRDHYMSKLKNVESLIIPFFNNLNFTSNYIFPIILTESTSLKRDAIRNKMHEKGVQTSVHYPAIHRFSIYNKEFVKLEITEYVSDNQITLPMYGGLKEHEVEFICNALIESLSEY